MRVVLGGERYPASILVGVFFLRIRPKKFQQSRGWIQQRGRVDPYSEMLENWWHVGVPTPSIENCHLWGWINKFKFESLTPFLLPVFLETFVGCQKNLHVQSFLVNQHVISWFFKIPVPFSKAFFHVPKEKTFFRSPWASEAEKKLQYRLGEDCYSKSTGGSQ